MTAKEVLDEAFVFGCEVYLRDDGKPAIKGNPNAALLGLLKIHRDEIVRLLGGLPDREQCEMCNTWVYEAEDSEAFCFQSACPFRIKCRMSNRI